MNKKKVELRLLSISSSQAQAGAYAMVLGEVDGLRQLPVIIGSAEAQSLMIEMRGVLPPRPLTHTLFASVLHTLSVELRRVLIYKVENGIFSAYLYLKTEETLLRVDARTSDAVALAIRMDAPIFIYDDILEAECLKAEHTAPPAERKTENKGTSAPEKTLRQLEAELQRAIDEENYERAAELRDIINQHKKQ